MSTAFETAPFAHVSPMVGLRARIKDEVGALIGAKELRLLSVKKTPDNGWQTRIEAFVADPSLTISNAMGTKEIMHSRVFVARFDEAMELVEFEMDEEA